MALAVAVLAAIVAGGAGLAIYTWAYRTDDRSEARWQAQMFISYCNVFDKHPTCSFQSLRHLGSHLWRVYYHVEQSGDRCAILDTKRFSVSATGSRWDMTGAVPGACPK